MTPAEAVRAIDRKRKRILARVGVTKSDDLELIEKRNNRKQPKGTPGGKGGQWAPKDGSTGGVPPEVFEATLPMYRVLSSLPDSPTTSPKMKDPKYAAAQLNTFMRALGRENEHTFTEKDVKAYAAALAREQARAARFRDRKEYPQDEITTPEDFIDYLAGAGVRLDGELGPEDMWLAHEVGQSFHAWKASGRSLPLALAWNDHSMTRPDGVIPMMYRPGAQVISINAELLRDSYTGQELIRWAHNRGQLRAENLADTVVHELAHHAHFQSIQKQNAYPLEVAPKGTKHRTIQLQTWPGGTAPRSDLSAISGYARANPVEFVAEAFLHVWKGGKLNRGQRQLYQGLLGPTLPE